MQVRRVAGCVPILLSPFYNNPLERIRDCPQGDIDCIERIDLRGSKMLMINSRKNPGFYVFPKGGLKKRELSDPKKAAIRETLEETGVEGDVFNEISGDGWNWYLLNIKTIHDDWMEKDQRERVWVPYELAKDFSPVTDDTKMIIKRIRKLYNADKKEKEPSDSDSD